ncbi:MAG: hypothetical protein V3U24_07585 [Candidatus Neomarinimicrobiota bacterium]
MKYDLMTILAFHLVIRHMIPVDKLYITVPLNLANFRMANTTPLRGNSTVPHLHGSVTLLTGDVVFNDIGMIIFDFLIAALLRRRVAQGAIVNGGTLGLILEVTKKTGRLSYGDMLALNNLGMTACATELLPSTELG